MDADEIVIGREQRHRMGVVLDLLGKGVRQPGKAPHVHPHREVRPFHVGRADVLHVGVALDLRLADACAFGRAVTALGAVRRRPIDLHELGIVHVSPECAFHGFQIGPVAVRRELDAIGEPLREIVDEPLGAFAVPATDEPRRDKLRIGVERGPRPGVASTVRRRLGRCDVLLFGVGEAPNLVDLDALGGEVAGVLVMVRGASLPRVDHEPNDRVLPHVHEPGDGPDRTAFTEEVKDLGTVGGRELVHAYSYGLVMLACQGWCGDGARNELVALDSEIL